MIPKVIKLFCFCFIFLFFISTNTYSEEKDDIIVVKFPTITNPEMPKVEFNHSKHVAFVDKQGSDCSKCHKMSSQGLSPHLLDVGLQQKNNQVAYIHSTCTGCHKVTGHGPQLVKCRSCHTQKM